VKARGSVASSGLPERLPNVCSALTAAVVDGLRKSEMADIKQFKDGDQVEWVQPCYIAELFADESVALVRFPDGDSDIVKLAELRKVTNPNG